jgi:hypothetical protein
MEYSVRTVLQRVTNRPHYYNRGDNIATTRSIYDDDPSRTAYNNAVAWRTTVNHILHHLNTGDHDNMGNAYNIHGTDDDNYYYCPNNDCPCNGSSDDFYIGVGNPPNFVSSHDFFESLFSDSVDDNLASYYDSDDYNPAYLAAYRDHLRTP